MTGTNFNKQVAFGNILGGLTGPVLQNERKASKKSFVNFTLFCESFAP